MLGKTYLFLTLRKTDGRVPSQQGAHTDLQPDILGSFPADIIGQFGCGHRAKFSPSVGVGGRGRRREGRLDRKLGMAQRAKFAPSVREEGKTFLTNSTYAYTSYSRHQITSNTLNCVFPSNTLLPRTSYFSQISQQANICLKNRHFEEKIRCLPFEEVKPNGHKIWSVCRVDD